MSSETSSAQEPSQSYRTVPDQSERMPAGIPYIIGNEAAERFSYYGMRGILTIFLVAHLRNSAGGPDYMSEEEAKEVYHLFSAAAYAFPMIGALLSDIVWGKYRTILFLSLGYCIGHACIALGDLGFAMAIMEPRFWLYLGLAFIAVGSGGIKPCVSAHVGDQFGTKNEHLMSKVFSWFYFSINVGAAASNMLTPVLLEHYGPWAAFGLPGVLMGLATLLFWLGRNKFVHIPPAGIERFRNETLSADGIQALKNLSPLFLLFVPMFWCLFDQTGSAWVLQAVRMDRNFLGVEWYESQIQAINPILILILIPTFSYFVYPFAGKFVEVTPLRKICVGLLVAAVAFGLSAWIEQQIQGGTVSKSSSQADRRTWQAINLLDGVIENNSWVSTINPDFLESKDKIEENSSTAVIEDTEGNEEEQAEESWLPQEIVVRLREHKSWEIDSIRIHPSTNLEEFLAEASDKASKDDSDKIVDIEPETCAPKQITVSVSDSPKPENGWTEVASLSLEQTSEPQTISFDPIEAKYVKVDIVENWGGPYVGLAEVEILAAGNAPEDCSDDCQALWPNVAAVGFRPTIAWQFLAYILITAAEIMVSIVCLEFAYTQAPKKMKSFIMGIYFLGVSLGNAFTAGVNAFIQNPDGTSKLQGADYYWFFTYCMVGVAILCIIWSQFYKGQTYIQGEDDAEAASATES